MPTAGECGVPNQARGGDTRRSGRRQLTGEREATKTFGRFARRIRARRRAEASAQDSRCPSKAYRAYWHRAGASIVLGRRAAPLWAPGKLRGRESLWDPKFSPSHPGRPGRGERNPAGFAPSERPIARLDPTLRGIESSQCAQVPAV